MIIYNSIFSVYLHRLRFYEGSQMLIDTNCLSELGLKGGKLGVFAFSQEQVIWSDLETRCLPGMLI